MIQSQARPPRPPRRASAPEFGQLSAIDAAHDHAQRTPPQDQAVHHIHRQVAKLELEPRTTYARSPSLECQMAAPLAAPPPPVSPPHSPRASHKEYLFLPETQAPDVVPWPHSLEERCPSRVHSDPMVTRLRTVSIDEVLAPLTRLRLCEGKYPQPGSRLSPPPFVCLVVGRGDGVPRHTPPPVP